jgi:LysM repeat protein
VHDDHATTEPPHVSRLSDAGAAPDPTVVRRPPLAVEQPPNPRICPFLRSIDDADRLGGPVETPDQANRCAALNEPVPQSLRQQELVCLTSGHVNCPRYLRGAMATAKPLDRVPKARIVTPAIAGSALALVGAFLLSLAFVVANGGLMLTAAATPGLTGAVLGEVETASPTPTLAPTPVATAFPTATVTPTASPSPTPSASPMPTPAPTPNATPVPTAKPTAKPTSSRYALLKPCPDTPKCYVYVVRSGDNLYSIVNYFGVSLKTVKAWNPWTTNGLKVGRGLRIPPPTR